MGNVKRRLVKDFYPPCEQLGEKKGEPFECACKVLVRQCFGKKKKGQKNVSLDGASRSFSIESGIPCAEAAPGLFNGVSRWQDIKTNVRIDGKHVLTKACKAKVKTKERKKKKKAPAAEGVASKEKPSEERKPQKSKPRDVAPDLDREEGGPAQETILDTNLSVPKSRGVLFSPLARELWQEYALAHLTQLHANHSIRPKAVGTMGAAQDRDQNHAIGSARVGVQAFSLWNDHFSSSADVAFAAGKTAAGFRRTNDPGTFRLDASGDGTFMEVDELSFEVIWADELRKKEHVYAVHARAGAADDIGKGIDYGLSHSAGWWGGTKLIGSGVGAGIAPEFILHDGALKIGGSVGLIDEESGSAETKKDGSAVQGSAHIQGDAIAGQLDLGLAFHGSGGFAGTGAGAVKGQQLYTVDAGIGGNWRDTVHRVTANVRYHRFESKGDLDFNQYAGSVGYRVLYGGYSFIFHGTALASFVRRDEGATERVVSSDGKTTVPMLDNTGMEVTLRPGIMLRGIGIRPEISLMGMGHDGMDFAWSGMLTVGIGPEVFE